jgi:hypothetical protein
LAVTELTTSNFEVYTPSTSLAFTELTPTNCEECRSFISFNNDRYTEDCPKGFILISKLSYSFITYTCQAGTWRTQTHMGL